MFTYAESSFSSVLQVEIRDVFSNSTQLDETLESMLGEMPRSPSQYNYKYTDNIASVLEGRITNVVRQTILKTFRSYATDPESVRIFLAAIIENSHSKFKSSISAWREMLERMRRSNELPKADNFSEVANFVRKHATTEQVNRIWKQLVTNEFAQRMLIEQISVDVDIALRKLVTNIQGSKPAIGYLNRRFENELFEYKHRRAYQMVNEAIENVTNNQIGLSRSRSGYEILEENGVQSLGRRKVSNIPKHTISRQFDDFFLRLCRNII